MPLDAGEVLSLGLDLVGVEAGRLGDKAKTTKFRAHYGSNPDVYDTMYKDMITYQIITEASLSMSTFLMVVFWLCHYPTEHLQSSRFKMCNETCRKWNWFVVDRLYELYKRKIKWPRRFDDPDYEQFILSVDGVHCLTKEHHTADRPYNKKDFSHKHGCAAYTYEVACAIWLNRCIWINGPYPAGTGDIQMFRMVDGNGASIAQRACSRFRINATNCLKAKIPAGKKGIADHGLRSEADKIAVSRSTDSAHLREFKGRVKARQETFNGRLKTFSILDSKFRHSGGNDRDAAKEKHGLCFRAVATICQYQMDHGSPLFDV